MPLQQVRLCLLDGFDLRVNDESVDVHPTGQRLFVYLAVRGRPVGRVLVASHLWPDRSEKRSLANLRTTLFRLPPIGHLAVIARGAQLALAPDLRCDVHAASDAAHRIIDGQEPDPAAWHPGPFLLDLLPGWFDEWLIPEQERYRQVRLHALEALCDRLTVAGRVREAVSVGLAAVSADPLRESATRLLIQAHLAEDNVGEARRQYERFRERLEKELGRCPSAKLEALAAEVTGR